MERNLLIIYDHDPLPIELDRLYDDYGVHVIRGYAETAKAIIDMQPIIATTQMAYLRQFFIKFGYDILLVLEDGYEVEFNVDDLDRFNSYNTYDMLDLYNVGDLYKKID